MTIKRSPKFVGIFYKITTDLTIAEFYEYRVMRLILSGATLSISGTLRIAG